jgi:hypothetical protein
MIIYASKNNLPAIAQTINSLGKYLYKNLGGAIDYKKSSNMFDIYTLVLYAIPHEFLKKYKITEDKYKEVYEMVVNINLTTYQQKIRVNLIEVSPDEITIGSQTFDLEKLRKKNPNQQAYFDIIKTSISDYMIRRLEKYYEDYDFLY